MEKTLEKYLVPVKELNDLTLKSIEKISAAQVKLIQENARLSIESLKAATAISDLDSLQAYLKEQAEVAQGLYHKTVRDAETITKLSESYARSVKELFEKSTQPA